MTEAFDSLWSYQVRGLVHVTGSRGVGKTTFAIETGADPSRIAFFDGEQSAANYHAQMNFAVYHDLVAEFTAGHTAFGSDLAYYEYVNKLMEKLESDYDVVIFENVSRFESGMAEYVVAHPQEFNLTKGQVDKMPQLAWGKMKSLYEKWLLSISNKASLIIVTTRLADDYAGGRKTGAKKPKGKDTLEWLSILQLWLRPNPTSKVPAAVILKERLGKWQQINGRWRPQSVLPYRLPHCTWDAIREYMRNPANLAHPAPGESLSDEEWHMLRGTLTDEQRLQLKLAVLDAEAEAREQELPTVKQSVGIQDIGGFLAILTKKQLPPLTVQEKLGLEKLGDIEGHVFKTLGISSWGEIEDLDEALERLELL